MLNNACKYTDPGGRISLTATDEDGHVVVLIRDNGMGIPSELSPKIFDMFTQADNTSERQDGGLGIGLASGFDHHLVKPVDHDQLLKVIQKRKRPNT